MSQRHLIKRISGLILNHRLAKNFPVVSRITLKNVPLNTKPCHIFVRNFQTTSAVFKKRQKNRKDEEDEEEEEEDSEKPDMTQLKPIVDDGTAQDFKVTDVSINTLRIDRIIKKIFGLTSSQCDDLIMGSKARLNNEKIKSKSDEVRTGDVLDVFLSMNADNHKFTDVSRAEIYSMAFNPKAELYKIRVKKWKSITVDDFVK